MFFRLLLLLCLHSSESALPSSWKTCKKSSPDFNECIKNDIQTALVDLRQGNEDLEIAPLEPYFHPYATVEMAPGFHLKMFNTSMIGLTTNKIEKVVLDDWKSLQLSMHAESMGYNFTYTFAGAFLSFKVDSAGEASVFLDDIYTELNMTFAESKLNGKTYLKVKDIHLHYVPQDVRVHFEPHNKNSTFGMAMNKLIKDNWRILYQTSEKSGDYTYWSIYLRILLTMFFKIYPKRK